MNSKEWVAANCKFAAWYDPKTWGKPAQPKAPEAPISNKDWGRAQFETPDDMISEDQEAQQEIVNRLPEVLPSILNHLEAARILLQKYGFGQYESSLNDIVKIMENVQQTLKIRPKQKSRYDNIMDPKIRDISVEKGLAPAVPRVASVQAVAFEVVASRVAALKEAIQKADTQKVMASTVTELEQVEKLLKTV